MEINKTTKRLLSASRLGVTFAYADGHRWVEFGNSPMDDVTSLHKMLDEKEIYPTTKVYGNIIDALNYVDFLLKKVGRSTLQEMFDGWNDWGFDEEFLSGDTNWEESGTETDEYFERCIAPRIFNNKNL
jgi:hypothetical protein